MEQSIRNRVLMVLGLALTVALIPAELWSSVGSVMGANFSSVDRITTGALKFSGPVFLVSSVGAGVSWGLSKNDEGMKKFFNGAVGAAGISGAASIASFLGFGGSIF